MAYGEDRLPHTGDIPPAEPWLGAWSQAFLRRYAGADEPGRAELRAMLAALEAEIARAQALRARERAN
jgi:hypothetical protein